MIRICNENDRAWLLDFLQKDPVYHTFLLADIEQYGFDNSFQQVYVQEEQGKCQGVYLRYYHNLILAGSPDEMDEEAVADLVTDQIHTVMGRGELVKQVSDYLDQKWNFVKSHLYIQPELKKVESDPSETIKIATLEDVDRIHEFLMSFPEFVTLYGEKAMISNRISNNEGIHLLIEKDGKLIAHGNSAASAEKTCMIGGICVSPEYRKMGYAQKILTMVGEYIHDQGKIPCIFAPASSNYSIFGKAGFEIFGTWAVINRMEQ